MPNSSTLTVQSNPPIKTGQTGFTRRRKHRLRVTGKSAACFDAANHKRWLRADGSIAAVVDQIWKDGKAVTTCAVQKLTGCHWDTVKKHLPYILNLYTWGPAGGFLLKWPQGGRVSAGAEIIQFALRAGNKIGPPASRLELSRSVAYSRGFLFSCFAKLQPLWRTSYQQVLRTFPITAKRSGAAINKREAQAAAATLILPASIFNTALNTSKELSMSWCPQFRDDDATAENTTVWTPSTASPKPPGNPYPASAAKRAQAKKENLQDFPPPPPEPARDEGAVPCPPEIKERMNAFFEGFALEKKRRDARFKAKHDNKNLTHLERLELADPADENWFKRNSFKIRQIFAEREQMMLRGDDDVQ